MFYANECWHCGREMKLRSMPQGMVLLCLQCYCLYGVLGFFIKVLKALRVIRA